MIFPTHFVENMEGPIAYIFYPHISSWGNGNRYFNIESYSCISIFFSCLISQCSCPHFHPPYSFLILSQLLFCLPLRIVLQLYNHIHVLPSVFSPLAVTEKLVHFPFKYKFCEASLGGQEVCFTVSLIILVARNILCFTCNDQFYVNYPPTC
jgi:hypothetical protein